MVQVLGDATPQARAALVGMVATALALLLPPLSMTVVDSPTMIALVVVSLTLLRVVRLGNRDTTGLLPQRSGSLLAVLSAPPEGAAGLTDVTHHPLRPRAPGLA